MVDSQQLPDKLESRFSQASLTPAGRRVVAFIRQNMTTVLAGTAAEIGERTGTSDATVVRTLQKLGFEGLSDLKTSIVDALRPGRSPADDLRRSLAEIEASNNAAFDAVIQAHLEALGAIRSTPVRNAISQAAVLLNDAKRIGLFGIGPSAALASYAATLLKRAGRHTLPLTTTGGSLADQLMDLAPGDAVLALAYGTPYSEILAVLGEARTLGLPRILLTERGDGPLVDQASLAIVVPRGRPGHVALHGGTLVAIEALIFSLAALAPDLSIKSLDRLNELRRAVR